MSDRDQPAEDLDDERLDDEYPPERPLAADDEQGITGLEQLGGESVEDREERTEPDVWRRRRDPRQQGRSTVVEEGARPSDQHIEGTLPVEEETSTGPLAPDDEISGDETPGMWPRRGIPSRPRRRPSMTRRRGAPSSAESFRRPGCGQRW